MRRKLWFRVVIYLMLFSLLISTILMGVSIF